LFPFFVGLIIGITAISATCEEYNKVRSALRWIPTFFVIDTAADIMGSETVQSVYQKVAKFIPNLSLHLFMNYALSEPV